MVLVVVRRAEDDAATLQPGHESGWPSHVCPFVDLARWQTGDAQNEEEQRRPSSDLVLHGNQNCKEEKWQIGEG
jgi:hypothetical protein